ncbi:hypothetical protein GQ53DRAFT_601959, partial [Thozetella sp. PMI_491]
EKMENEWAKKKQFEDRIREAAEKGMEDMRRAQDEAKKETEKAKANAERTVLEMVERARKAEIKFKDAIGREFNFPLQLCQTWLSMEDLIKQAFLHVDRIGPHVQEGEYDLIGPNGEIILPCVWEKAIQP